MDGPKTPQKNEKNWISSTSRRSDSTARDLEKVEAKVEAKAEPKAEAKVEAEASAPAREDVRTAMALTTCRSVSSPSRTRQTENAGYARRQDM